jgi:hypothetical protein
MKISAPAGYINVDVEVGWLFATTQILSYCLFDPNPPDDSVIRESVKVGPFEQKTLNSTTLG